MTNKFVDFLHRIVVERVKIIKELENLKSHTTDIAQKTAIDDRINIIYNDIALAKDLIKMIETLTQYDK